MVDFSGSPSSPKRVVLQAIWDLGVRSARWPTFAELEQELSGKGDVDVWDVLAQLPSGLVTAMQADLRLADHKGELIGLTVAGAAVCTGTGEALDALLNVVKTAARLERGRLGPGDGRTLRGDRPVVEFARDAGVTVAEHDDLLTALILLLQIEPCGWRVYAAPYNPASWLLRFDPRVTIFADVVNVPDYVARLPWNQIPNGNTSPVPNLEYSASETAMMNKFNSLAADVYRGVRDSNLRPEAAFDLASFLMEQGLSEPVIVELADQSVTGGDDESISVLARQTLHAIRFEPDFALEPRLFAELEQALEVTKADLRSTGVWGRVRLALNDGVTPSHAQVEFRGYTSGATGIAPSAGTKRTSALTAVADDLQAAVIEARHTVWPVCPRHRLGAHAHENGEEAVWWCNGDGGHVIALIGRL